MDDAVTKVEAATSINSRFDAKLAQPFIYKSVSEETRAAYHRAIREFFAFAGGIHPTRVTPADVIAYQDHLRTSKRRKANTVAMKLGILRSFFEYLKAGGVIPLNPASTKLVTPSELPTEPKGRALTPKEVKHLLSGVALRKLFSGVIVLRVPFAKQRSRTMKRRTSPALAHRSLLTF